MIDRTGLAEFLRTRRAALQPEDVGLPRGSRRRTSGLRREEVAAICHMSADYYSRLERERGPKPSAQMLTSIAQGLRLSLDERDHLFRLGGQNPPPRGGIHDHLSPGILRIFDRLHDTPAEVVTELGETLRQTPVSVALVGDLTRFEGPERSSIYRWFTVPGARARHDPGEHAFLTRMYAAGLRELATLRGPGSRAAQLADQLLDLSAEFREVWGDHEIGVRPHDVKHFVHPEVGALELNCQRLVDPGQSLQLMVYTATPGSESAERLALLSALAEPAAG